MKKTIMLLTVCIVFNQVFGQSKTKISNYVYGQYSQTIYDRTLGNNPWSLGLAFQTFFHNQTRFKPTIEATGDIYLEDDKVLRDSVGYITARVDNMINVFGGISFHPQKQVYVSFIGGPSLINNRIFWGIKPSIGFYFTKDQKWTGKISYINIFNRDKEFSKDFGTISAALGIRIFSK